MMPRLAIFPEALFCPCPDSGSQPLDRQGRVQWKYWQPQNGQQGLCSGYKGSGKEQGGNAHGKLPAGHGASAGQ